MKARAATAAARGEYYSDNFDGAAQRYREASKLLQDTPAWQGHAALYDAWALLADAEGLSRGEPVKATQTLESVISRFEEAEKALQAQTSTGTEGEREAFEAQRRLLIQGRAYAEARLLVERARTLERHGKSVKSMDQLAEAARRFEAMSEKTDDVEIQDLMSNNALVCSASRSMLQAEQQLNPDLYAEASGLFQKARKNSKTKHVASLADGWAACCKTLELGLRYRESSDASMFQAMKKQLTSAMGYFVEAGASNIVSWLKGTGCMFDAMAYLAEAEASLSSTERESHYGQAEQQLRIAAELFERADYPARKGDAILFLQSTVEQRKAIAARLIRDAPVTQSVAGIAGPTGSQELLVGGGVVATPYIHAALRGSGGPLYAGHETKIHLTILNPGQSMLRLVSVENLDDQGLDIDSGTEEHRILDGKLELNGKRLSSLGVFELPLKVRPRSSGEYKLQPRVQVLNLLGEVHSESTPPLMLSGRGWHTLLAARA